MFPSAQPVIITKKFCLVQQFCCSENVVTRSNTYLAIFSAVLTNDFFQKTFITVRIAFPKLSLKISLIFVHFVHASYIYNTFDWFLNNFASFLPFFLDLKLYTAAKSRNILLCKEVADQTTVSFIMITFDIFRYGCVFCLTKPISAFTVWYNIKFNSRF